VRALLTSPLGFLIGLSIGAVGAGGSILAVPALVYAAGQSPRSATTTSLLIVGVSAAVGLVTHHRARRVRWGAGVLFGVVGIGGSLVGSILNADVNPDVLLLAFSGLMLVAAFAMCKRGCRTTPAVTAVALAGEGGLAEAGESCDFPVQPAATPRPLWSTRTIVATVIAGTLVGFLTGFFGVGGGFVIVPALVLALGFTMPEAIGTSLLVIVINTTLAFAMRVDSGTLDWRVIVPWLAASILGVMTGSRIANRVDRQVLTRIFVVLLVAVALYTAARSALALL
jgi:uncharacterized membrane protein YfcA